MSDIGAVVVRSDGLYGMLTSGRYTIFNSEGLANCCCSVICDYCLPPNLVLTKPAGQPFNSTDFEGVGSPMPKEVRVTLSSPPFAGTYSLHHDGGSGAASYSENRTLVASANAMFYFDDENVTGGFQNCSSSETPIYAGAEYEVTIEVTYAPNGDVSATVKFHDFLVYGRIASTRENGNADYILSYNTVNLFSTADNTVTLEASPALDSSNAIKDSRNDYDMEVEIIPATGAGSSTSSSSLSVSRECEWIHDRFISGSVTHKLTSNQSEWCWNSVGNQGAYLRGLCDGSNNAFGGTPKVPTLLPITATDVGSAGGWVQGTIGGDHSNITSNACYGESESVDRNVLSQKIPFSFQDDISVSCTLTGNNRFVQQTGTAAMFPGGTPFEESSYVEIVGSSIPTWGLLQSYLRNNRSGTAYDGMVALWFANNAAIDTVPHPCGQIENVPVGQKGAPENCSVLVELEYTGVTTSTSGGLEYVTGLQYDQRLTVAGSVISNISAVIGIDHLTDGYLQCNIAVANTGWRQNNVNPTFITQYTGETFNDNYKNSVSNLVVTGDSATFKAPENAGRVNPILRITSEGDIDDCAGTHTITLPVNQAITPWQVYDAAGVMVTPLWQYQVLSGQGLPLGLTMDWQGVTTGTPTVVGTTEVQVVFGDKDGFIKYSRPLTIIVE